MCLLKFYSPFIVFFIALTGIFLLNDHVILAKLPAKLPLDDAVLFSMLYRILKVVLMMEFRLSVKSKSIRI